MPISLSEATGATSTSVGDMREFRASFVSPHGHAIHAHAHPWRAGPVPNRLGHGEGRLRHADHHRVCEVDQRR